MTASIVLAETAVGPDAGPTLAQALGAGPFAAVILFATPRTDLDQIAGALLPGLGTAALVGCTTAGEIGATGYTEGRIVAIGLPAATFRTTVLQIETNGKLEVESLIGDVIRARNTLASDAPDWRHEFACLLVDGLSNQEDMLTAALAPGLGPMPLFGGSAADGRQYLETRLLHGARTLNRGAVLLMARTCCPVRVFKLDHLRPTDTRMIVTEADPEKRLVRQINGAPAAAEYARLLGKDPAHLNAFTFASHPVLVQIGGTHHVRAIRQLEPNGDLSFFGAIDEGLVLTVAEADDIVTHLQTSLDALCDAVPPDLVVACDCILRRMEAEDRNCTEAMSRILSAHRVRGFSTYGEQWNALHVNQTMTGVAIYPPEHTGAP